MTFMVKTKIDANGLFRRKTLFSINWCYLNIMSAIPQLVFHYSSSEDSQSPPEKRAKKEFWESRLKKFETGDKSDCKIIVANREILTHKSVLIDFPYFEKKFNMQSNFKVDERDQIIIRNYEFPIVYEMVKYMYSFKVTISTENVQDLLRISDEFRITRLFDNAEQFIVNNIGTDVVIECLVITEYITNARLLKSKSIDYVLDHYFELKATESWKRLTLNLMSDILDKKMQKSITKKVDQGCSEI